MKSKAIVQQRDATNDNDAQLVTISEDVADTVGGGNKGAQDFIKAVFK
jgi:hypothetical protein